MDVVEVGRSLVVAGDGESIPTGLESGATGNHKGPPHSPPRFILALFIAVLLTEAIPKSLSTDVGTLPSICNPQAAISSARSNAKVTIMYSIPAGRAFAAEGWIVAAAACLGASCTSRSNTEKSASVAATILWFRSVFAETVGRGVTRGVGEGGGASAR